MSLKFDLPDNLVDEYNKYNQLYLKGNNRSFTGNVSYTSTSSGSNYSISDNTGENGLLDLLKITLQDFIVGSNDFNSKVEQSSLDSVINNNILTLDLQILDLYQKVKELTATTYINKISGIGFYDTFSDNSNIDTVNSTATYNTSNKNIEFVGQKLLQMKPQTFSTFNTLSLNVYPNKINNVTIKGNVSNSTTVITGVTDKVLSQNDKLFISGATNVISNLTGNYQTCDRTTPINVVSSLYTPTSTARPQVLSNNWMVTAEYNTTNTTIYFQVSKDGGATYSALTSWVVNASGGFALCSFGTKIYAVATNATAGTSLPFLKFDVTNVSTIVTSTLNNIDTTVIYSGNTYPCIAIDSTGTTLIVAWVGSTSTYLYGYKNIKFTKSIDDGSTWTTQSGVGGTEYITTNSYSYVYTYLYAQFDNSGSPLIFSTLNNPSTIYVNKITNNAWASVKVYSLTTSYPQEYINTVLQKYGTTAGRLWCVWDGKDTTYVSVSNIKVSYSDDNGSTWSTAQYITTGNTYIQKMPSITCDNLGNTYVIWSGVTSVNTLHFNIRMAMWNSIIWGSISEVTAQNTKDMLYPVTCKNLTNFAYPITIYQDNVNNRISLYGKFTIGSGYTLTMQTAVTLNDGQLVPIADFSVKNANTDLTLKSIDTEKFYFQGTSLNTTTATIKVTGKDNKCTALAYAIV